MPAFYQHAESRNRAAPGAAPATPRPRARRRNGGLRPGPGYHPSFFRDFRPPKLADTMCFYVIYGHPTSILPPWVQIWPKCVPGCPFQAFWRHGPRCGQNVSQKANFKHTGAMGPDMTKMCPRRPISSILDLMTARCATGHAKKFKP